MCQTKQATISRGYCFPKFRKLHRLVSPEAEGTFSIKFFHLALSTIPCTSLRFSPLAAHILGNPGPLYLEATPGHAAWPRSFLARGIISFVKWSQVFTLWPLIQSKVIISTKGQILCQMIHWLFSVKSLEFCKVVISLIFIHGEAKFWFKPYLYDFKELYEILKHSINL